MMDYSEPSGITLYDSQGVGIQRLVYLRDTMVPEGVRTSAARCCEGFAYFVEVLKI